MMLELIRFATHLREARFKSFLMLMENNTKLEEKSTMTSSSSAYQYHQFKNGIRLIHRYNAHAVSHLALMVNVGSRDEAAQDFGIAHLIEHMVFKGTHKRKAFHIISRLENVGCDLNAYTTKEETCLHATFLYPHYERALELFADIAFNSVFPSQELEKEKEVILDEIHSYRDNPAEEIVDEFENQLFNGHEFGHNILGTVQTVQDCSRDQLINFCQRLYTTDEMVIASVGNIPFEKLIKMIEKYYASQITTSSALKREKFNEYIPSTKTEQRDNYLSHCYLGNVAYDFNHPSKITLVLLNNVLGGPGLNSRLNLNIREKFGFTYSIDSQYTAYSDLGWIGIYLGTDNDTLEKTIKLVHKELKKLREEPLGVLQLSRAKQQLIVQLAIGYESGLQETLSIARSHIQNKEVENFASHVQNIERITAINIMDVAQEVFDPLQLSTLIFKGKVI